MNRRMSLLLGGAVVAHLLLDYFLGWDYGRYGRLGRVEWMASVALGLLAGQTLAIAMTAALASTWFVQRVLIAAILGIWISFAVALGRGEHIKPPVEATLLFVQFAIFVPFAVIAIGAWIFDWRMTLPGSSRDPSSRQFGLRQLLVAIAVVAITCGAARLFRWEVPNSFFWRELSSAIPIGSGIILANACFVGLPILLAALLRWTQIPLIACLLPVYLAAVTLLGAGVFGAPDGDWDEVTMYFIFNITQGAYLLGALLFLRALGVELIWKPKRIVW